jgi:hypothetical protein
MVHSMKRNLAKSVVCLFALLEVAFCGSIQTDVGGNGVSPLVTGVVGAPALNTACTQESLTGAALSLSNCAVYSRINPANGQPESFTVGGAATASYASIGTSSSISLVNADLSAGTLGASGFARVIDNLVTQLPATDEVAFVFNLNGSVGPETGLNLSRLVLSFGFNFGSQAPVPAFQFITTSNTFSGLIVTPANPVSVYQAFPYFFSLSSQNLITTATTSTSYNASGNVDFSHTLSIAGVGVWDANGNLLATAAVGSANNSGSFTVLNVPEVLGTPEPGTTLTFLAGMSGVTLLAKRLKR